MIWLFFLLVIIVIVLIIMIKKIDVQHNHSKTNTSNFSESEDNIKEHELINPVYPADIPDVPENAAETVFLYWCRNGKPIGHGYPKYFFYKYGIADPKLFHQSLIDAGLLELASPEKIINSMTIDELIETFGEYGIKRKKTKKALIQSILSDLPNEKIKYEFRHYNNFWVPSEFGKKFLAENDIFVALHKHSNWQLDYDSYLSWNHERTYKLSFYDFAELELNRRSKLYFSSKQYGSFRNDLFSLYELYIETGKKEIAVSYILTVLYFDLCSPDDTPFIAPGIVSRIFKLKPYITQNLIKSVCDNFVPGKYCTKEQYCSIVSDILSNSLNIEYWENYFDKAQNNFSIQSDVK